MAAATYHQMLPSYCFPVTRTVFSRQLFWKKVPGSSYSVAGPDRVASLSSRFAWLGTRGYAAPEQFGGVHEHDLRAVVALVHHLVGQRLGHLLRHIDQLP